MLGNRIDVSFAASVGATLAPIHCATANQEEVGRGFSNDDSFLALRLDPYLLPRLRGGILICRSRCMFLLFAFKPGSLLWSMGTLVLGIFSSVLWGEFFWMRCAWYGDPAFDVAFALYILLKSVAVRNSSAFLLDAFDAFADAYLSSVNWEPRQDIESRVVALLPALALARVSGKSPVEYLDPSMRKSLSRLRHTSLSVLRHGWTHSDVFGKRVWFGVRLRSLEVRRVWDSRGRRLWLGDTRLWRARACDSSSVYRAD